MLFPLLYIDIEVIEFKYKDNMKYIKLSKQDNKANMNLKRNLIKGEIMPRAPT